MNIADLQVFKTLAKEDRDEKASAKAKQDRIDKDYQAAVKAVASDDELTAAKLELTAAQSKAIEAKLKRRPNPVKLFELDVETYLEEQRQLEIQADISELEARDSQLLSEWRSLHKTCVPRTGVNEVGSLTVEAERLHDVIERAVNDVTPAMFSAWRTKLREAEDQRDRMALIGAERRKIGSKLYRLNEQLTGEQKR